MNMKLKNLVAIAAVIGMVVSLVGCSSSNSESSSSNEAAEINTEEAASETETTEENSAQETDSLDYPKDTIHIVVTFSAGGGNDLIARAVAAGLEEVTGVSVVVDNVTGAGGMTGSNDVVNAAPDGYQILCQDSSLTAALVTQASESPFTLDDLVPVCSVFSCPTWVVSSAETGYASLQDFIDDAKANPGKLTIGTAVTTGAQYLCACAIVEYFDLDVTIVPYEGGGELKAAILGNHVDIGVVHSPILLPEVQEGLVNVMVAGDSLEGISDESLRDMKTLADYGIVSAFSSTRGFLVPKDTPQEIVNYLENAFKQSLDTDAVKEFEETFGYESSFQDEVTYSEFLKNELAAYQEVFVALQ